MRVRAWASTAPHGRGAIACVELAGDVETLCARIGVSLPGVGGLGVRDLAGVDEGVVVRWHGGRVTLMTHGAPVVVEALLATLCEAGAERASDVVCERFPEARSLVEACALDAVGRCASPVGVDVLLGQLRLWEQAAPVLSEREHVALSRLLHPPLVVAIGRANVGKSTLLNALASRCVSVVSAEAGTTRDHVGVSLDLERVRVRWVDTPGVRDGVGSAEARAGAIVTRLMDSADLVVHCGDAEHGWLEGIEDNRVLRCATRGDLGVADRADVVTAAGRGDGVAELAKEVRERLVPGGVLEAAGRGRWVFDAVLARGGGAD